ncbi:hypothetical protein CVV26_00180 [Candidatus Kuenenbacteria bacterium HGW-Kuenenbacteria-1]|uniref:Peptidase S8/S53 domain-containing protein n=1 Tax=Candidatus Kuenenbacteria bacterium HGW-Kuenenbacteria-1 TaxID=2013812 RepID=A0A2N1UP50_9BACT|nr:MAG: hypothetical protein CVV26_00180 [Candidatus Kuenenbacteria bacterium HGW-Kuenenbacteria-1]
MNKLLTIFIITLFFGFAFPIMALVPNDTYYSKQWYLPIIKADKAWEIANNYSSEIIVAVLDAGVDINHPDLKNNIWTNPNEIKGNGIDDDKNGYIDDINGWDFIEDSNDPNPKFLSKFTKEAINHGTIITGIIAAEGNNNQGIIGISPKAKIMCLRVLNEQGNGNDSYIAKAVDYAVKNKARVLNLSFVGSKKSEQLSKAIERAWKAGLIIVTAAGNGDKKSETQIQGINLDEIPLYPICYNEQENKIIGVGAVDNKDQKTNFSNFGKNYVDISAPGIDFYGTQVYNSNEANYKEYYGGFYSGTSIAAPQVTATAALIWSQFPNLTNKEVQDFILDGVDNISEQNPDYKDKLGKGRLNVYQALKLAQSSEEILKGKKIFITSDKDNKVYFKKFNIDTNLNYQQIIYSQHFDGGINMAIGDIDKDGKDEIVTGPNIGEPLIKIFDTNGNLKFQFLAYDLDYNKGISVAIGDIDGDGKDEIITGPKSGEPLIKIFDTNGNLKFQFLAFNSKFKGGVNIATGDINGDKRDELIVSIASQESSYVRVYKLQENDLYLEFQTMIFNSKFKGGVNIATGDINGDKRDELIVSIASEESSYVRVYKIQENDLYFEFQFMAYSFDFKGGVNIATGDIDEDGKDEIITSQREAGQSIVKIFDKNANLKTEFKSFDSEFQGGINVAIGSL